MENGHGTASPTPQATESSLMTAQPLGCIEPTAEDILATETLLHAPEDPLASIPVTVSQRAGDYEIQEARYNKFIKDSATSNGLTLFDGANIAQDILRGLGGMKPAPESFDAYLSSTQTFVNQLGVDISLGKADVTYAYGGRVPTSDELVSKSAAYLLADIVSAFSNLPKEYIELAGLKHIVIVAGTDTNDVAGYAETQGRHDTIVLDILKAPDQSISVHGVNHELYHLLDAASCNDRDMSVDMGYAALNGGRNMYSGKLLDNDGTYLTYTGGFQQELNIDVRLIDNALSNSDDATRCQIVKDEEADQAQVAAYSNYHPNPAEDKAELGAVIPDTNDYVEFDDPKFSVLYPKFRYLLARLYHQNPGLVRFFTKTSRRPAVDPTHMNC
ncbi:MAG TPA: hypothetical protein VLE74_04455 [Candidatus Saccharimonadales bacterium]|nr:hypothetical protein [Candidatus Saccharimonadales bacterium]